MQHKQHNVPPFALTLSEAFTLLWMATVCDPQAILPSALGNCGAEPSLNRPFGLDKAIFGVVLGSLANAHDQRLQGAMTTEILYP
jgi:hypothetical protein